jgi:hypothetical protein
MEDEYEDPEYDFDPEFQPEVEDIMNPDPLQTIRGYYFW